MLEGLVCVVTGGASGLGKGTAERFVREGSKVVICDLPESKGNEVSKSLGENALFVPCDVTSEEQVRKMLEACIDKYGKVDVLVNCAGAYLSKKIYDPETEEVHSLDKFIHILKVNVFGTFNTIRLSTPFFYKNKPDEDGQRGVIINIASVAAFDGCIGQAAYSASKGAIVGMTLPLARDLASHGIRNVTIAPGMFRTPPLMTLLPEEIRNRRVASIPFPKRLGLPEEFAHMVQTIVENKMLNGETIRLDGAIRM